MDQLRAMKVFVKVVDEGGFARAARALDLAPPVVTRIVAELETALGARLLNRTTRRVALTDAGEHFLDRARSILRDVDEAVTLAGEGTRLPRGHLRVLCPPAIAVHQLAKHLPRFLNDFPQVTLELVSPGPVDTLDEAFDVTLFASRDAPDGDFVARRLARTEIIACASPAYLERHGRPLHPRDLAQHRAVRPWPPSPQRPLSFVSGPLRGVDGGDSATRETYALMHDTVPTLVSSHIDTMYAAALAGVGIAGLPSYVAEDALRTRRLERVLPAWRLFDLTLWAGIPSRHHVPARTRAFLDFLLQVFGGEDRDPWLAATGAATRDAAPDAPAAGAAADTPAAGASADPPAAGAATGARAVATAAQASASAGGAPPDNART